MFDKITFTHDYWIFVLPLVFMAVDITKFFSVLITFTELNSNIENLALLGVPVPDWMRRRINQTIDEMNAGDEKEEGE